MGAVSGAWPGWDEAAGRARCAADQLARQIAFGDDADRHALRRKVAQCHRQWQGKIKVEATRELGVLRAAVLGVRVSGFAFPLTLIAGGFGGAGRDLYDLNAASVLACMLTAAMVASNSRLGLGGVGLLRMIVARGTSVRPRLSEPPDGWLALVPIVVALQQMAQAPKPVPREQVAVARALVEASRCIAADFELDAVAVPIRLRRLRRARLRLISRAVAAHGPALLAAAGPADVARIAQSLTAGLAAWARGDGAGMVDAIPADLRRSILLSTAARRAAGVVCAAAAAAVVGTGSGRLPTAFIAPALMVAGAQLVGIPQALDTARLLLAGSTAPVAQK